ncbi:MAG TPA: hypothetical protein VFF70_08845 [Anaerolineae bacterium]|jgi:hypothetical protein|nr:hypothetical protein [Anaerolineae bacterium]
MARTFNDDEICKILIGYLDHCTYSAQELTSILKQLRAEGLAIRKDDRWFYQPKHSRHDRSFIF